METSAIHQTSQAKNIPCQPLLIRSIFGISCISVITTLSSRKRQTVVRVTNGIDLLLRKFKIVSPPQYRGHVQPSEILR